MLGESIQSKLVEKLYEDYKQAVKLLAEREQEINALKGSNTYPIEQYEYKPTEEVEALKKENERLKLVVEEKDRLRKKYFEIQKSVRAENEKLVKQLEKYRLKYNLDLVEHLGAVKEG